MVKYMKYKLFGCCFGEGGLVRGSEDFPLLISKENSIELIYNSSFELFNMESKVRNINLNMYNAIKKNLNNNILPIIIGGDHSVVAGGIMALSEYYDNLGVIWIDAHADFNDKKSTKTGNMHGMPLSAVCGLGPDSMIDYSKKRFIKPENIVLLCGRDYEEQEIEKLNNNRIKFYMMSDIYDKGLNQIMNEIKNYFKKVNNIHVSFDVDSISSEYAPGTGTPVTNGITIEDAKNIITSLKSTNKIVSFDLVEVNPRLDNNNVTINIAKDILKIMEE